MGQGSCIDRVDIATQGYIFDELNTGFGNLVTFNSMANPDGNDDSDHDYNGADGRLVMQFDPLCIQDINVRHMMLEFVEVGDCAAAMGDMNSDGFYNVLDIVTLANCVLMGTCEDLPSGCAGDMNGDDGYNVLDIVTLANCVLNGTCG